MHLDDKCFIRFSPDYLKDLKYPYDSEVRCLPVFRPARIILIFLWIIYRSKKLDKINIEKLTKNSNGSKRRKTLPDSIYEISIPVLLLTYSWV